MTIDEPDDVRESVSSTLRTAAYRIDAAGMQTLTQGDPQSANAVLLVCKDGRPYQCGT